MNAAKTGSPEGVQMLLEAGADPAMISPDDERKPTPPQPKASTHTLIMTNELGGATTWG